MKAAIGIPALLCVAPLAAQIPDAPAAYNQLRTPTSPAFVVLGVTPTAVERPNTPADIAFSILNSSGALTSLPKDVAIEFSPYWLFGHPKLEWRNDVKRGLGTSLARTATLSFATAELGSTSRPVTGLAFGFRASPFSGELADTATIVELEKRLAGVSVTINERLAALRSERRDALRRAGTHQDSVAVTAHFDSLQAPIAAALAEASSAPPREDTTQAARDSNATSFRGFAVARRGFVLEIAAGAALQAPNATADSASLGRWGAWLTAGYQGPTWSFIFVNRFLASEADSTFDGLDVGMRLLWTANRYAVSAEGVFRSFTESGAPANEYRVAAVIDFEVQKGLWLMGSFGRDYSASAPGSLIAQFGLSMNVAGERIQVPIRSMR